MTTTIHVSGPAQVLSVLPYQLGYHPRDSLVALSLRGRRVGLVQRIDLPRPEQVREAVAAMLGPLRQDNPEAVMVIGFEDREGQSRMMLDELAGACEAEGIVVSDRLVVRRGRWFAPDCDKSCCPSEGLPLPDPSEVPAVAEFVGRGICPLPDRSALADQLEVSAPLLSRAVSALADEWLELRREATRAGGAAGAGGATGLPPGLSTFRDFTVSEDIAAQNDHRPVDGGLDNFRPANDERDDFRASELAVWGRVLSGDDDAEPIQALPPQDLAMLAVSLTDVDLRDGLIAWMCPGTLPRELIHPKLVDQLSQALAEPFWVVPGEGVSGGEGTKGDNGDDGDDGEAGRIIALQRVERRLCQLCAALPDKWAVSALTVLASFTWWRGDGALTRIALDRALRVDPDYRLAVLLELMVDQAIRPQRETA